MIKKIRLQGLLSFEDMELELRNLNVLIGPNGSGKSNLIEALSLLQALPTDIGEPLRRGGGIDQWLRSPGGDPATSALVETRLACVPGRDDWFFDHRLALRGTLGRYEIAEESIEAGVFRRSGPDDHRGGTFYRGLNPVRQSVFASGAGDPLTQRHLTGLGDLLAQIRLYREWSFGVGAIPRQPRPADQVVDFLSEDSRNLALIVNELIRLGADQIVNAEFKKFFGRFRRFGVEIFGNQVLLYMNEDGLKGAIPATRWSDGMIRYLCLLAILCHPNPPGLICIDEPDLGFHPDILPNLARLIKSASERTQIIITTHSAELINQFTDEPESVVVCERDFDGATQMKRQDPKRLKKWLKDYALGDLWRNGEIGGNPL